MFRGGKQILSGLQMVYYFPGNKKENNCFSPEDFINELRLNSGYFTPDRLALLEL